jgi:hypothetical protein
MHAGGRCTDGIWLSARHITTTKAKAKGVENKADAEKSTLVLFMDCEGIGSLERTGTEDMLHCLLAGAVASFTMFKTHFAFNRCGVVCVIYISVEPHARRCIMQLFVRGSEVCMFVFCYSCMHA